MRIIPSIAAFALAGIRHAVLAKQQTVMPASLTFPTWALKRVPG